MLDRFVTVAPHLLRSRHLRPLLERIVASTGEARRVGMLATDVGFSRAHLNRIFRETLGETPARLERRLRLERAAYLLSREGRPVVAVGKEVGYATAEAFSRAFRKRFGVLPSHFSSGAEWKTPNPSGIHWDPDGVLGEFRLLGAADAEFDLLDRPPLLVLARRFTGTTQELAQLFVDGALDGGACLALLNARDAAPNPNHIRCYIGMLSLAPRSKTSSERVLCVPGGVFLATREPVGLAHRAEVLRRMRAEGAVGPSALAIAEFVSGPGAYRLLLPAVIDGA